jgi:hypothetical protein
MIVNVEQSVEWELAGKTEVLGEKTCPSATFSSTNPPRPNPGSNPGRRSGKPATNRLSYGAAYEKQYVISLSYQHFWNCTVK